jgi:hypothetical protein
LQYPQLLRTVTVCRSAESHSHKSCVPACSAPCRMMPHMGSAAGLCCESRTLIVTAAAGPTAAETFPHECCLRHEFAVRCCANCQPGL